tara:strand:+ start:563 stop:1240 length:678 start_codon:yes stop_codon:yes gene_type:complete
MGRLIIIPTPIGNLDDITIRAVKVLNRIDILLAEDKRTTNKLLNHFSINVKTVSYHQYNEHKNLQKCIDLIKNNELVGLVSDAGTPSISDPGFLLVRECIKNEIIVECLPGPTALIPALVKSGFSCENFIFYGFIPAKKGRKSFLLKISQEEKTMIFYESPHRLLRTLNDFKETFKKQRCYSVTKELSKIYEETKNGKISELISYYERKKIKGEFVIVVNKLSDN